LRSALPRLQDMQALRRRAAQLTVPAHRRR
jgi:hypothetical protein